MMSDGYLCGDGSWELRINVTDLRVDRTLRVKGDLHIGGVMLKLVEDLDIAIDWSDHALWWPTKNMWLSRTRSTLDQYGVSADAFLHFTPMHKTLRIQMPDLQYRDCRVDFSCKIFNTVIQLTKELGIRHPEELSLCRPLTQDQLKRNQKVTNERRVNRSQENGGVNGSMHTPNTTLDSTRLSSNNSLEVSSPGSGYNSMRSGTPIGTPVSTGTWKANCNMTYSPSCNGTFSNGGLHSLSMDGFDGGLDTSLVNSPQHVATETKNSVLRPKSLVEKARMNAAWLDSSLSLMEQDVREFDSILLRFKFFSFYDLNPKYDLIRINQIYEQAKWALLTEELDCTEEEMMMFAALQVQINLQSQLPQPSYDSTKDDDIDAALTDLQITLEGSTLPNSPGDITQVPELAGYLRFLKPKRFTLKGFKRFYFTFKDTSLSYYKGKEDLGSSPIQTINLKGCEVAPDVNISQNKYGIKLEVPFQDGMSEMWIRCESEEAYAKWMAACRLASKGKTMADSSYDAEVASIQAFLSMQHPSPMPAISPNSLDIQPEDYVAARFIKKLKGGKVTTRILEAHANVKDLNLMEAKLSYIKAWQALPDYGVSLFLVKFEGSKKEELLGVASNRLMRKDVHSGDHLKTWRYNTMMAWNVNWEVKHVVVQFEEQNVAFACLSADCKIVHEFIGGYIFLSMRSKDQNQTLNEELFHKLTGGWI